MKQVIFPSSFDKTKIKNKKKENPEKSDNNLAHGNKLMNSILENDKKIIDDGLLITNVINYGVNFTPDMMFESIVKNYDFTKQLYGKTIIRKLTGYNDGFIKKNLPLPEFKRELKEVIEKRFSELKKENIIDAENQITEQGYKLSSLVLYAEELDNLIAKGYGEKILKKEALYGEKSDIKDYKTGDLYKNISLKKSIWLALKRNHKSLLKEDLKISARKAKGKINIIYAIDSSGSMRGKKIEMAKKAGIALMYKALDNHDKVGLILFRTDITEKIPPLDNFSFLLEQISKTKALKETNLTKAISESISLFPKQKITKHLVLITDAMPTVGKEPEKEALEAIALARNNGITISLVGINLNKKGTGLAKKITELGKGRLYVVRDIENLDVVVLEDYYQV
ncbi:VWA domain-containing protein [Candidatus Woesearchaeota archaeon]|nr:VWA domain-containing protein [Candidatus Woesearchaeota archaeon]